MKKFSQKENFHHENTLINLFFKIYANKNNINSFQVGEYNISKMNIATAINSFNKGNTYTRSITITEGMNIYDLNEAIEQLEDLSKMFDDRVSDLYQVKGGQQARHAYMFYRKYVWETLAMLKKS